MGKRQGAMENMELTDSLVSQKFWLGRRVLVTGHSGFKGSWLTLWLSRMGANLTGISLPPIGRPNLFTLAQIEPLGENYFIDIRDAEKIANKIRISNPDIIFHLAAQSLVRAGYQNPLDTFSTNVMGTANLLNALRGVNSVRVVVLVTSDKVYLNREWHWPYREDDTLGGNDPYSASKAASEIVSDCYRKSFLEKQGIALATARAGNVIGGGDWSEDRLIPDAVRAWQNKKPLLIRRPDAVRPWQYVLEPLAGYLTLAEHLWDNPHLAGAYNFGPATQDAATVRKVIERARTAYGEGEIQYNDCMEGPHEAGMLALEVAKSRKLLGYVSRLTLDDAICRTMSWYKAQDSGEAARSLCEQEIDAYNL